ncbi:MAG: hypothetical protein U5M23_01355 [Marinagarivorans sp.]|nr:hypothetical protein [Marinagarivorans sp.]
MFAINAIKKEFRVCWRFWSLRIGFIASSGVGGLTALILAWPESIVAVWASIPDDAKAFIPDEYLPAIAFFIFAASALNRIVKERAVKNEKAKIEME